MYSMVVMMAMSSSPEAVACGKLFNKGCTGCYGTCTGVVYSGCTGVAYSGCTGCTGYSCHGGNKLFGGGCNGCKGGGLFSGGLFSKKGCHGSSCYGSSCYGSSCYGSSCTGYVPMGCTGGVIVPSGPVTTPPVVVPPPKKEMPPTTPKATSAPATITLMVPADAKVTIDGNATTSTTSVRVFSTPSLEAGNLYTYTFTAEINRDGKVFTASKEVVVVPGETAKVELNPTPATTVAAR